MKKGEKPKVKVNVGVPFEMTADKIEINIYLRGQLIIGFISGLVIMFMSPRILELLEKFMNFMN